MCALILIKYPTYYTNDSSALCNSFAVCTAATYIYPVAYLLRSLYMIKVNDVYFGKCVVISLYSILTLCALATTSVCVRVCSVGLYFLDISIWPFAFRSVCGDKLFKYLFIYLIYVYTLLLLKSKLNSFVRPWLHGYNTNPGGQKLTLYTILSWCW